MSAWVESASEHVTARHDEADAADVPGVLALLEATHARLGELLPVPDEVTVVLHSSDAGLLVARPGLVLARRTSAPAARRYVAGAWGPGVVHVLAPRRLAARGSGVAGSREALLLTPAALLARLVLGTANPRLPPPVRPGRLVRAWRWAWLVVGAGAWLSGQTGQSRGALARRLHEGPAPAFPPAPGDAQLLGGTLVDLLAREEGERAVLRLATELDPAGPREGLVSAFRGRPLHQTEATWRAHPERLAGVG